VNKLKDRLFFLEKHILDLSKSVTDVSVANEKYRASMEEKYNNIKEQGSEYEQTPLRVDSRQ